MKRTPAMYIPTTSRALLSLVTSLGFVAAACGSDAEGDPTQSFDPIGGDSDGSHNDDDEQELPTGNAARGKALADELYCESCHTPNYAGAGYYANITQDESTGIGSWSDDEIARAIVSGLDDQGKSLCALMPRSELSDEEVADMVAFLRTVAPVANEITKACPGR